MASQLNIKDPVLIERIRALATQRGQPVTTALRFIVDREWEAGEAERRERLRRMEEWSREAYAMVPDELRGLTSKEIMDSIYDDEQPDGFVR